MLGLVSFKGDFYCNSGFIITKLVELPLNGRPTFIRRPASKVPEKLSAIH